MFKTEAQIAENQPENGLEKLQYCQCGAQSRWSENPVFEDVYLSVMRAYNGQVKQAVRA